MSRREVYAVLGLLLVIAGLCAAHATFYAGAAIGAGTALGLVGVAECCVKPQRRKTDHQPRHPRNEESERWSAWETGAEQPNDRPAWEK